MLRGLSGGPVMLIRMQSLSIFCHHKYVNEALHANPVADIQRLLPQMVQINFQPALSLRSTDVICVRRRPVDKLNTARAFALPGVGDPKFYPGTSQLRCLHLC